MSENNLPGEIYSEKAAQLRNERIAYMTQILVSSEGQPVYPVLLRLSKSTGRSMKTINEYWEVISEHNSGPIYEKHGIIRVRRAFKRWVK
ncbi:MAG: hypothetical protein ABR867_06635 [Nitrososphaerales archaeon]